jgi:hypothetical protein
MPAGRPAKYKTAAELDEAIQDYFDECVPSPLTFTNSDGVEQVAVDKNGNPIIRENPATMAGLAYHLGYSTRGAIYDLETKDDKQFSDLIKRARLKIEAEHESRLTTSDKCTGSIFWLKNHQWTDRQEITGNLGITVVASSMDEKL